MRLWTLHPKYLDTKGLVAAWREGLMAQSVLNKLSRGLTPGYRNHSQLIRFKPNPKLISTYLHNLVDEADARKYKFDRKRILHKRSHQKIQETTGQLYHEWLWLLTKLKLRDRTRFENYVSYPSDTVEGNPLFDLVPGPVRDWEKAKL